MKSPRLLTSVIFSLAILSCHAEEPKMETSKEALAEPTGKVQKTDAEWKKELTPEQYRILREAGT